VAREDVSGRLSVLVLWLVCMACAHGRAESLDERSAALLVAVRYTMLKLASPDIRADDRRTWEAIPFCIDVDEQPPDSAILNVLRTEGFEVHGDKRECMRSDRSGGWCRSRISAFSERARPRGSGHLGRGRNTEDARSAGDLEGDGPDRTVDRVEMTSEGALTIW